MANSHTCFRWMLGTSLICAMTGAFAEVPELKAGSSAEISEIVVTVERVSQSLQSYAGTAITATQGQLDSLGAENLVDLPSVLPGVEISNYEDNTNIYIRGIGSDANTELGDPAVAPHLDDVYVPRPRGLGVAFFDLERVEVNVGPQGTIRGRNALGGTINIVSKKPELGKFDGYAEFATGNYDHKEYRGALNLPIGDIAAARLSVYSANHDPFVKNVGPLTSLTGWESQDDFGGRLHFLIEPIDHLSVLATGDYLRSRGTGTRGIDFFPAAAAGIQAADVSDPRQVDQVAFNPTQDTRHWGISLNTKYRTDFFNVQYIGGYRDLHYQSDHPTGGRFFAFPGINDVLTNQGGLTTAGSPLEQTFINERIYNNYSALIWDTTSKMHSHELRLTSPDNASRLTWATGLYYFKEHQRVFLGIPLDYGTLPYLEFNQGSVSGESKSAYGDMTFGVTDRWKVTGGVRYSDESKARDGFNLIGGFDTNGVAIRTGTPGFSMTGLSRTLTRTADGNQSTLADLTALYLAGIASSGINDTLNTFVNGGCVQTSAFGSSCANYPGLKYGFGGATLQHGQNSAKYYDWRFRSSFELADNNLLYGLIATGNKAPSFNDTVDVDQAHPGTHLVTPPVGPEKDTMVELGSKNVFQVAGRPLVLNGSVYYVRYTDQVFSAVIGVAFLSGDKAGQAACLDNNASTPCPNVTLNQNVGKSYNKGFQLDSAYSLGHGFAVAGTLLLQDAKFKDGSVVSDGRRGSPAGGPLLVDLGGNNLPRTPPVTVNFRLNQAFAVTGGMADWVVSTTYKSSQYLTGFNGGPGNNGSKVVTAVDVNGKATGYGADQLRMYDKVNSYTHVDLGTGYTHDATNVRVEAYVNNVTNEAHGTQATIDNSTQEFIFNPPRTFGVRMHVSF